MFLEHLPQRILANTQTISFNAVTLMATTRFEMC